MIVNLNLLLQLMFHIEVQKVYL